LRRSLSELVGDGGGFNAEGEVCEVIAGIGMGGCGVGIRGMGVAGGAKGCCATGAGAGGGAGSGSGAGAGGIIVMVRGGGKGAGTVAGGGGGLMMTGGVGTGTGAATGLEVRAGEGVGAAATGEEAGFSVTGGRCRVIRVGGAETSGTGAGVADVRDVEETARSAFRCRPRRFMGVE
jgi:hypothetical protein